MQSLVGQYRNQANNGANVVLSVAHPAIDVLLDQGGGPSPAKEGGGLRQSIRQAILYLMDEGVSPRDLDADAFEALCKLITYQEKILPPLGPPMPSAG